MTELNAIIGVSKKFCYLHHHNFDDVDEVISSSAPSLVNPTKQIDISFQSMWSRLFLLVLNVLVFIRVKLECVLLLLLLLLYLPYTYHTTLHNNNDITELRYVFRFTCTSMLKYVCTRLQCELQSCFISLH